MSAPELSVVIPSHERPLRLRWLLNSLEEQSFDGAGWEIVVCHDSSGPETEELLRTHPLARAGVLRHITLAPGTGSAARQRNVGWREARAPIVAFIDDDCRAAPGWLAAAFAAAHANPGAIVQGRVTPDPEEEALLTLPYARSLQVEPPVPWAQTANIVYPRDLLERTGGFAENIPAGEDTELFWRAIELGASCVAEPQALVWHAVDPGSLRGRLRSLPRWSGLAYVVKRHPHLRRRLPLGIFWKWSHPRLVLLAFALAALARRRRLLALVLALPWVMSAGVRRGMPPRHALYLLWQLPGQTVVDAAEFWALLRGSVRYRNLFL